MLFFLFITTFTFWQINCNKLSDTPDFTKTNVIIFFTKPDVDLNSNVDDGGISFLKFPVKGRVQSANNIPEQYKKLFSIDPKSSKCNEIFNACLMNLIEWATNVKHMVTATITTSESEISSVIEKKYTNPENNLQGYDIYRYSVDEPKKIAYINKHSNQEQKLVPTDPYKLINNPDIFGQLPLKRKIRSAGLPLLKYETIFNDFPVMDAFNPEEISFNDRDIYDHDDAEIKPLNMDASTQNSQLEKELTTTQPQVDIYDDSDDKLSSSQKNIDAWNTHGLFEKIQQLFFDSFLFPNEKRSLIREENSVDPSVLGTVKNKPMYDLVRYTLENLRAQTRLHSGQTVGYLMIVIGGNISEASNPFSDLVQSVKYVLENTDKTNTLVLVSCYCPNRGPNFKRTVPFYAGGANCEEMRNSYNMLDMFSNIRAAVKKWSKNRSGGNKYRTNNKLKKIEKKIEDDHVLVGGGRMVRSASISAAHDCFANFIVVLISIIFLYVDFKRKF